MKRVFTVLAAALGLAAPAGAIFIRAGEPVPLDRLFRNVGDHVRRSPKDARGHYTLGRLHSLAFVKTSTTLHMIEEAGKLPRFPPYESIQVRPAEEAKRAGEALHHLGASIRSYRRATELDPKTSLYWMGLGWMLEQGAPYARETPAPWGTGGVKRPSAEWLDRSLGAYRKAYALDLRKDLTAGHIGPGADTAISLEAGEGILRILEKRRLDAAGRAEQARVRESVRRLADLPRAVTPIVFPLKEPAALRDLLSSRVVPFDLAGDGRAEQWPWVNDRAGILVWDPDRTGRVTSGSQLFGSATWSMYWRDGYEALAALDDDLNGRLTGRELRGLAVWHDRDGDAVSDPGEVEPVTRLRLVAVAVRPETRGPSGPAHSAGIELRDGTRLPTYDWMPVSIPARSALSSAACPEPGTSDR